MPTVNAAPLPDARVASGERASPGPRARSRLRRAATFTRLAAADVLAIAGAAAALLPLLGRRRPLGRAAAEGAEGAPPAPREPAGRLLPR